MQKWEKTVGVQKWVVLYAILRMYADCFVQAQQNAEAPALQQKPLWP